MKHKIKIWIPLALIFFGCLFSFNIKQNNEAYNEKEAFIKTYKYMVFYSCLDSKNANTFKTYLNKNNDRGVDHIVLEDINAPYIAFTVGKNYSKKIENINYEDLKNTNTACQDCYMYSAFDKEVDSLANAEYLLFLKSK